jgi:hypothetical protein
MGIDGRSWMSRKTILGNKTVSRTKAGASSASVTSDLTGANLGANQAEGNAK